MLIATLALMFAAAASSEGQTVRSGPVGLVFSVAGSPLSAQQVEERSPSETLVSQVYRDSAGRMRIEYRIPGSWGGPADVVYLVDKVERSTVTLMVDAKIAFVEMHSGPGPFNVGFPAVGILQPATSWQTKREALGKRVIEGFEAEGTRNISTPDDRPALMIVQETWSSSLPGVTLLVGGARAQLDAYG